MRNEILSQTTPAGQTNNQSTLQNANQASSILPDPGMLYGDYLMLDQLLSCQEPVTRHKFTQHQSREVHDEHLFIITHQVYELWFKQIIYELDSVRLMLNKDHVEEAHMLLISSQLNRIKKIFDVLTEQFGILSTMTPLDFMDFRDYLAPASGFQSFQFRLMENKLGIRNEFRTNYRKNSSSQPYLDVFRDPKCIEAIRKSEQEPSLCKLIERWLERTPGLEVDGFNFWEKYKSSIKLMLETEYENELSKLDQRLSALSVASKQQDDSLHDESQPQTTATSTTNEFELEAVESQSIKVKDDTVTGDDEATNKQQQANCASFQIDAEAERKLVKQAFERRTAMYDTILDEAIHKQLVHNGTRRFSHKALQGALIISLYRDEPRFNQPYQLLVTLMDIDDLLIKWRQNHAQMVLRMIGGQLGTGGSSGYNYLRTTISQKYNIFLDLFNLSTFLPPKAYIPKLSADMRKQINSYHA